MDEGKAPPHWFAKVVAAAGFDGDGGPRNLPLVFWHLVLALIPP